MHAVCSVQTYFLPCANSRVRTFFSIFFVFACALAASAENIKDIHPTGYVTDLARVITPDAKTRLENLCLELEQKTGAQMAIVTVRSLQDETVDQYGNELYKQLGVGSKKDSRGVLLLVAPTERKYRDRSRLRSRARHQRRSRRRRRPLDALLFSPGKLQRWHRSRRLAARQIRRRRSRRYAHRNCTRSAQSSRAIMVRPLSPSGRFSS